MERRRVVLHRDAAGGEYREVSVAEPGATVAPVALELAPLNPDELFAAAFAERQV